MHKMQAMARQGMISSRFAHCPIPAFTACLYRKATRKPWRVKGDKRQLHPVMRPHIDQLISATQGYFTHLRGSPTRARYQTPTIFVDHYSGARFVQLQRTTSAAGTIEAIRCFETWPDSHGIVVRHYHADNDIFADNEFRKAVSSAG